MSMLEDAARVSDAMDGERNAGYGHPLQNFATIAALWSAAFGREFSREDVALAMILLKVARLCGPQQTHRDSWVDIAGYVNCVDAIHEANGAPKTMEELTRQYMREHQAERQEQVRERHDIVPDDAWTIDSAFSAAREGHAGAIAWINQDDGMYWDEETQQIMATATRWEPHPPDRPLASHCPDGGACKRKCGLEPCKEGRA